MCLFGEGGLGFWRKKRVVAGPDSLMVGGKILAVVNGEKPDRVRFVRHSPQGSAAPSHGMCQPRPKRIGHDAGIVPITLRAMALGNSEGSSRGWRRAGREKTFIQQDTARSAPLTIQMARRGGCAEVLVLPEPATAMTQQGSRRDAVPIAGKPRHATDGTAFV